MATAGMMGAVAATQVSASEQPNILIIILDDAGYNDFTFMDCPDIKTPQIDRIAQKGVTLTDGHVTASVSGPSRCGLLTGRYQQRGGYECNLGSNKLGMNLEEKTIADLFKDNGYKTYCIGKWHQGSTPDYHPNKRGFDEFYGFLLGSRSYLSFQDDPNMPVTSTTLQHNGKAVVFNQYLTYELGDKAVEYIKDCKDQPFMMYLSYNAVHSPYQATEEDMARFEGHPRQKLAAMTYAVDKSIGQVLDTVEETGKMDNTLIFFIVDNGGAPSNQICNAPLKGAKGTKYEGGHRVPYSICYGDKLPAGSKFDGLSSSLDIMTTAAAAAGIDVSICEKPLDGVDLMPYLKGEKQGNPHKFLFWRKDGMAATRMDDYKYIRIKALGTRLYNMKDDLGEEKDIQEENPEIVKEMTTALEAWEKELVNPVLWNEGNWIPINIERHRLLMNNLDKQAAASKPKAKKQDKKKK